MAFEKGSRFKDAFNREILNMKVTGVIDKLVEAYIGRNKRSVSSCDKNSVGALGFTNVFTPFSLIALGAIIGIFMLVLETIFKYLLPNSGAKLQTCCPFCELVWQKELAAVENILGLNEVSNYQKIKLLQKLLQAKPHKHGKECDW